jgi:hypothetical protein
MAIGIYHSVESPLLPFAEELAAACFSNKISHFDEQLCASNISTKTQ